ncbi:hypothetical protein [Phytohabitans rumicis]|uniref:Uncharacterized protein n=1 Tax=Phytohabitans rumicis TaxID=1076125 RepID=A0A6V8L977_9ACTN|nr:hypothetical protein [Phytohabitans rumicis]GFJ93783.1 hypothetical protein Prum_074250 [Phytohabitans rumicis]
MAGGFDDRRDDAAHAKAIERVEGSFRDVYLTLVSIIQGVALGFLIQAIGADYRDIGLDKAGRAVAAFLAIVVIWQEYAVGSTMYAWIPGPVDALVPFLLGAGQGVMIAALDAPIAEFLFLTILMWGTGFIAAINYAVHAKRARLATTRESQKVIALHPRTLPILDAIGLTGVICMLGYCLSGLPQPHPAVFSWLLVALIIGLVASAHWRWARPMRPH